MARVGTLFCFLFLSFTARLDAQWIGSAYGGAAFTRPAEVRIEQPDRATSLRFARVPFAGRSLEPPVYYGYRVWRAVPRTRTLFAGAEFIHAKAFADGSRVSGTGQYRGIAVETIAFADVVQRLGMSHGLNFVLANGGLRRPLGGRVTGTITFGAGPLLPHAELQIDGAAIEGYELGGIGTQLAIGADVRVWRGLSVLTEYKWTRAAVRLTLDSGQLDLTATSHHLVAGLSAAF